MFLGTGEGGQVGAGGQVGDEVGESGHLEKKTIKNIDRNGGNSEKNEQRENEASTEILPNICCNWIRK